MTRPGYAANSTGAGTVTMTVADSVAVENGADGVLVAGANATAIVSGSSLVRNGSADLSQVAGRCPHRGQQCGDRARGSRHS
jgi:hypothetical protein